MYRHARAPRGLAPGLTPVTGKYLRPDAAFVCQSRFVPGLVVAVDHDISGLEWGCTPAHTVISEAKLIYFTAKFLSKIVPIP